ncbi:very-long-chain 3-oxoacyl-CoA reductase-like isoform 2-T2 [Anomaloglossus baeobatrachus]|uniref:very-long-chain 3-oxoacyl-CoA reductase-like isoform X2 n=1 Tax=Anomaloglossus baeobatrachus TaxID=238106 RepID=UPI003F4FD787
MAGDESCLCTQGFTLFGILAAAYIVISQTWKVIRGLRNHIISHWWKADLTQYGRWAEKESGRKIKYIQADFTNGANIYHMIQEELKSLEIGILVNNVGMKISESPTKFLDAPNLDKMIENIINCNILSAVQMTRIVLPQMVQRKKGLIINISSEAGKRPYPMALMYSSSKVFVDFFSRGLHTEYKSKGITVQCVMPLLVSTDMTYKMKTNIFVKSSDEFAHDALNTVGYTERTSGCLTHSLQSYGVSLLSDELLHFVLQSKLVEKHFNDMTSKYKNKEN